MNDREQLLFHFRKQARKNRNIWLTFATISGVFNLFGHSWIVFGVAIIFGLAALGFEYQNVFAEKYSNDDLRRLLR